MKKEIVFIEDFQKNNQEILNQNISSKKSDYWHKDDEDYAEFLSCSDSERTINDLLVKHKMSKFLNYAGFKVKNIETLEFLRTIDLGIFFSLLLIAFYIWGLESFNGLIGSIFAVPLVIIPVVIGDMLYRKFSSVWKLKPSDFSEKGVNEILSVCQVLLNSSYVSPSKRIIFISKVMSSLNSKDELSLREILTDLFTDVKNNYRDTQIKEEFERRKSLTEKKKALSKGNTNVSLEKLKPVERVTVKKFMESESSTQTKRELLLNALKDLNGDEKLL